MTKLVHPGQLNPRVTVSALSDDVLLEVFGFCVDTSEECDDDGLHQDRWLTLVHVCQRWRCVVFSSPRTLNLRLFCTDRPVKRTLDIWPELPIVIYSFHRGSRLPGVTNIIAALKQQNRVCKICIDGIPNSLLQRFAAPFPALTDLELLSTDESMKSHRSFPIRFWADLPLFCSISGYSVFLFRHYRNYFCLPPTSSIFNFRIFHLPVTSHPRQSSLACPH
jgi:hypothetical protein